MLSAKYSSTVRQRSARSAARGSPDGKELGGGLKEPSVLGLLLSAMVQAAIVAVAAGLA